MATLDASRLLRQGLLEGVSILVAGTTEPVAPLGGAVEEVCTELGARVHVCACGVADEVAIDEAVTAAAAAAAGRLDLLVVDGAGLFARALADGGTSHTALRACLDATWNVTRVVVNHAFLPGASSAGGPTSPGGPSLGESGSGESSPPARRIVYLAPAPDAGEHADAARAGLENLGRTLSIEWARHGITLVTIAPGATTAAGEVAALCAYLASPAGAYFSGCLLDLRGP